MNNAILIIIKRLIILVLKLVMKELEKIQLMAFVKFVLILIAKTCLDNYVECEECDTNYYKKSDNTCT